MEPIGNSPERHCNDSDEPVKSTANPKNRDASSLDLCHKHQRQGTNAHAIRTHGNGRFGSEGIGSRSDRWAPTGGCPLSGGGAEADRQAAGRKSGSCAFIRSA